ncbi:ATP-dependent DNA helicase [Peribacillus butanolivorans]|uniref:ATP-dependent DNA helicase n=2 Tax=Peribacillus butanolivorans TaxID=421767 RepID=A0AAX0S2J8_9BACI|nr:ATP-dependent DNA helicase [Peribacillus butanolivorans]AXN37294.1 ATP-dependent DNA helicase [Peribacillus butanolivorans]MCO0596633.1 ATP-dependent DNA helicase [Peribacillus butanolivorans]PEJ31219.1 ATP-dependent helicase [Peribacillus butanolivorans]
MLKTLPFSVTKEDSFYDKLSEWIGDVFYDILPEKGFELRDEQIFMAFQLEKAFKEKNVSFAEAGVGTGKTLVYLLYAICYARYTNKPAIISCADETLIEQLVKEEGDIQKIKNALGIEVDVRLAKYHDQYVCLKKLEYAVNHEDSEGIDQLYDELPKFVHDNSSMNAYTAYGDRKQYPYLNDEDWSKVGWDQLQNCFTCDKRHRCGQTLSRDHYRKSSDLIICSHDFFMEHVWTKEKRKREGQLPLLPEHSCVVFDEGHLLEFSAQKALTYKVGEQTLASVLELLTANQVREETLYIIEDLIDINEEFFDLLDEKAIHVSGSNRYEIPMSKEITNFAQKLHKKVEELEENLVFEAEMYTINDYDLKVTEEYLEQLGYSLSLFVKDEQAVSWFEENEMTKTLVIMPRLVQDILSEQVFSKKIPYIFSSATLSDNKSFQYIADSLGIDKYDSFSVESPFDYDEVMKMNMPVFENGDKLAKLNYTMKTIEENEGRTLVLFQSKEELLWFKENSQKTAYPFYFEGEAEISDLVKKFQEDEQSVLFSYHLWEGLDVPGASLQNVVIHSLPFPPHDPVFEAKRNSVTNAFEEVDLPYMLLRLRQGIGRLIRTSNDSGSVQILIEKDLSEQVKDKIISVLPVTL